MLGEIPFEARLKSLPWLGLGLSTEFGAGREGLDPAELQEAHPEFVEFLEIGADLERGIDADAQAWARSGRPVTYHFLDVNLEEGDDLDEDLARATGEAAREIGAAWLCGDAGLWHVGRRERGHGMLMPPILVPESAAEMARGIRRLRALSGFEVLPENPPAQVYLGSMSLLEYFAEVMQAADCGMLLDVAHLAIYQRVCGRSALEGLDAFPAERVVEVHVAGGLEFEHEGRVFVEDEHGVELLDETWEILEALLPRLSGLRATVFECERNSIESVTPVFERLRGLLDSRHPERRRES